MNLYFLDKDGNQHLILEDVHEEGIVSKALEDLAQRHPDFKSYYQRTWWDNFHRYWIDYGSHTEFYILQEEKYALHVVKDAAVEKEESVLHVMKDAAVEERGSALHVVKDAAVEERKSVVEEEKPACNRFNRDYCDI